MAKSKRKKKRKEPLRVSQVLLYALMSALVIAAVLLGIACILFEHLVEGVIILAAVIVLVLVMAELVYMDRKANKRKRVRSAGATVLEIKEVSLRWHDGERDFGNVQLGTEGFTIDGDEEQFTCPWVALMQYTVPNPHVLELWFSEDDRVRVTCNSDLKMKAAEQVLAEHVAKGGEA